MWLNSAHISYSLSHRLFNWRVPTSFWITLLWFSLMEEGGLEGHGGVWKVVFPVVMCPSPLFWTPTPCIPLTACTPLRKPQTLVPVDHLLPPTFTQNILSPPPLLFFHASSSLDPTPTYHSIPINTPANIMTSLSLTHHPLHATRTVFPTHVHVSSPHQPCRPHLLSPNHSPPHHPPPTCHLLPPCHMSVSWSDKLCFLLYSTII